MPLRLPLDGRWFGNLSVRSEHQRPTPCFVCILLFIDSPDMLVAWRHLTTPHFTTAESVDSRLELSLLTDSFPQVTVVAVAIDRYFFGHMLRIGFLCVEPATAQYWVYLLSEGIRTDFSTALSRSEIPFPYQSRRRATMSRQHVNALSKRAWWVALRQIPSKVWQLITVTWTVLSRDGLKQSLSILMISQNTNSETQEISNYQLMSAFG